jgi:small subunit ribosomal protein S17
MTSRKDIGLGIEAPKEECQDRECPWHGSLAVRGKVLDGHVKASKSHNTAVVEWAYHRFIPKYQRYQRGKSTVAVHNPPCMKAREGDKVLIAECKPISKTKHFVIVKVNQ